MHRSYTILASRIGIPYSRKYCYTQSNIRCQIIRNMVVVKRRSCFKGGRTLEYIWFVLVINSVFTFLFSVQTNIKMNGYFDQTEDSSPTKFLSSWDIAIHEAKELLSLKQHETKILPSCLVPNKKRTRSLVRDAVRNATKSQQQQQTTLLPLPIINVGMPKSGSTSLYSFFDCIGMQATHWNISTVEFEGLCMRDAASLGLPPIATCSPNTDAFMELNVQFPPGVVEHAVYFEKNDRYYRPAMHRDDCFFPQLSLLEEIHAENPNVTFVMNFRPIDDWIASVQNWYNIMRNFKHCHLPNLPRGIPRNLTNHQEVSEIMTEFICSHVQHIRNFVQEHPSHALIELDLYDSEGSKQILSKLFPITPSAAQNSAKSSAAECWGHVNKSPATGQNDANRIS